MVEDNRYSAAVHEAGHAVTAWRLGVAVEFVTIVESDDYLGLCRCVYQHFDVSPDEWGEVTVHNHIVVGLAGGEAERRHRGGTLHEGACDHDIDGAVDLALAVTGSAEQASALLEDLLRRAVELLDENWAGVEAVAERLLEGDVTDIGAVLPQPLPGRPGAAGVAIG